MTSRRAHPFMPNSMPAARQALLDELGVASSNELFEQIPESHRLSRPLELPPALSAESELRRHMTGLLAKNRLGLPDATSEEPPQSRSVASIRDHLRQMHELR